MAREKRLKPLHQYLKPPAKAGGDNVKVAAGLRAMEKRGLAVSVKRIKRKD